MNKKLKKEFYIQDNLTVAKLLLGKIFVYNNPITKKILSGKIVEVEAYDGNLDEAAHTYIGKTERNKIMFNEGGFLYVYFIYGIHFCANIVTGNKNHGTAVLLRAMEPKEGIKEFSLNKYGRIKISDKEKINLLNGPAKICKAFGIDRSFNSTDLTSDKIYLLDAPKIEEKEIIATTRIGIKKSTELPWRFYIKNNRYISKK
ncbi:MAG: 3-methyladenine DNA glycosylase [Ignavibacteriae bacterium]|nr:MAG: 3-methyladenine DNA glycosylase [Ignavibacteriota bacterium]